MTLQDKHRFLSGKNLTFHLYVESIIRKAIELKRLNAFIRILPEEATAQACLLDTKDKSKPLAGKVFAVKDNIHIRNVKTTCGSRILSHYSPPFSATVIQRLEKAGVIFLGKTNMDEFAMGSSGEHSAFGSTLNPVNENYVPGGSSSGSAVAVAAEIVDAALGSDTGGSVRQPASFTGIVGLKPSYGRVSRYGLVSFSSSLDQIGLFTRSVKDSASLLPFIEGHDPKDSTTVNQPLQDYLTECQKGISGLTIGLPEQFYAAGLDEEIKRKILSYMTLAEKFGAKIVKVTMPLLDYAVPAYYIISSAEASSNLARYDGAHFGNRETKSTDLDSMFVNTRSDMFGDEVKRRIMLGTYVLSAGYYDAYYKQAQKVRRLIKEEFDKAFRQADILITPTTPGTAFRLGEKKNKPLKMYQSDLYTVSANLTGICAMSVPGGLHSNGLPFGVQIMAPAFREDLLFRAGVTLEQIVTGEGQK